MTTPNKAETCPGHNHDFQQDIGLGDPCAICRHRRHCHGTGFTPPADTPAIPTSDLVGVDSKIDTNSPAAEKPWKWDECPETYVEIQMEGFNKLVLKPTDTLQTMLEIMDADWNLNDPIKATIGPVEMTPKDFEELPEWEG